MPIEFNCPGCSKLLRTPDASAGKRAKCPQCGTITDVPAASAATSSEATPAPLPGSRPTPWSSPPEETLPEEGAASPFATKADPANPYATPVPVPVPWPAKGEFSAMTPRQVALDEILTRTWQVFTDQLGPCALFGLVFLAITIGVGMASGLIRAAAQATGEPAIAVAGMVLQQVIGFLVNTFFQLGMIMFSLRLARSGQTQLNDLFAAGPFYLRGLAVQFLLQLMVMGAVLLCLAPGLVTLAVTREPALFVTLLAVGGLIALVLAVYLAMRFYLANVFVIDRNQGVFEAFQASSTYMVGNKFTTLVAGFVVGILGILFGLVTCCVGFVLVVPFTGLLVVMIYLLATGQPTYQPQAGAMPVAR